MLGFIGIIMNKFYLFTNNYFAKELSVIVLYQKRQKYYLHIISDKKYLSN